MFKHPNVVPITAAKLDSKQQPKEETIPLSRPGTVTRMPIRQMLAADHSYGTRVQEEKLQAADFSAPIRGKIVYMPRRSCDDSCNT
jgi:hypothetical protein